MISRGIPPLPLSMCCHCFFPSPMSLNPLSPHIFILVFFFFFLHCFPALKPFCFTFGLSLSQFIWGRGSVLGKQGREGNLGQEEALEGGKKIFHSFLFCSGDCRMGWIACWRSPSVMEMVMQVALPSALSEAMPCSPTLCLWMQVEGEDSPECETLLYSLFFSVSIHTCQALSTASSPFPPHPHRPIFAAETEVGLKGVAGRGGAMCCVSSAELLSCPCPLEKVLALLGAGMLG